MKALSQWHTGVQKVSVWRNRPVERLQAKETLFLFSFFLSTPTFSPPVPVNFFPPWDFNTETGEVFFFWTLGLWVFSDSNSDRFLLLPTSNFSCPFAFPTNLETIAAIGFDFSESETGDTEVASEGDFWAFLRSFRSLVFCLAWALSLALSSAFDWDYKMIGFQEDLISWKKRRRREKDEERCKNST